MNVPWQVVIASADVAERRAMRRIMAEQGVDSIGAATVRECVEVMAHESVGLIFCARSLADGRVRDLLRVSRNEKRRSRIVPMIGLTDWDEYLEAMHLGAFDVISAPCRPTDVEWMIIQALRDEHARTRLRMLEQQSIGSYGDARVSESA